jgi:membrane protease YdiL (CAAX protease family)
LGSPLHDANRYLLRGQFGLRAGWSVALFVTLVTLAGGVFGLDPLGVITRLEAGQRAVSSSQSAGPDRGVPVYRHDIQPGSAAIGETLTFAIVIGVSLGLSFVERRRVSVYGINRANVLDFFPGVFWGLAMLSLLVVALHAFHVLFFDARMLHGPAIYGYGLKWMLVFLFVGLSEEYITRGFLQFTLTRGLMGLGSMLSPGHARAVAFWIAAIIMSAIFGTLHLGNPGETPSGIAMVFLAGMLFSYALWRTGSLWWAIGFHMSWDWAQSFLWGVPDSGGLSAGRLFQTHAAGNVWISGGADGPEGSVLVLPTLLLVALVIRFTTTVRPQPALEPEKDPLSANGNGLQASPMA